MHNPKLPNIQMVLLPTVAPFQQLNPVFSYKSQLVLNLLYMALKTRTMPQ